MLEWNEEREVKSTLTRGKLQLTMFSGLIQGPNTNSSSQCEIIPRVTYHTPYYFSTNVPVQPQYPDANINGDAAPTWGMNTAYGEKADQIDGKSLHIVEGNNLDNAQQCVV